MRILVTGSRDWPDEDWRPLDDVLREINPDNGRDHWLIHGNARGVDLMAENLAYARGWQVHRVKAKWAEHGRAAGFIRNQEMVDMTPDVCVVFRKNMSRGATDCGNRAVKAGIKTYWIEYEDLND